MTTSGFGRNLRESRETPCKMRILITGGAGFIGSHLCEKYASEGHSVICLDNLQTTATPHNIEHLRARRNFRFLQADIVEPIPIDEPIDWIFNFACSGSYTSYQYDPIHTMKTNTVGMANVLELARRTGARVLQASTSEVYGDPVEVPQKETYRGNVNMLGPRACYDEGKRAAETLCMDFHRQYGTDVKIIRIFNTYGPRMQFNDGRAVSNFITAALSGRDIVIYGDGLQTRSFQYIDDLVEGIDRMMRKDGFMGPVNLGNPVEITISALAEKVKESVRSSSRITFDRGATDDPRRRVPDITLARETLGWEPKVGLDEGLEKTIAYFRTAALPEKKVLVFSTTYFPYAGPAEQAFFALTEVLPETEFHIITARMRRDLLTTERIGWNVIYRVGFGNTLDKYLLPLLGVWRAYSLHRKNRYTFLWSIMGSYSGIAAALLKRLDPNLTFLLTLHEGEMQPAGGLKARLAPFLYRFVFRSADVVYTRNDALEEKARTVSPDAVRKMPDDTKVFMQKLKGTYDALLNKKMKKLDRPK